MEQLMATTKNIDRSSAQIVTITKTMEDIAFQTKLLALNAPRKRRARVLPESCGRGSAQSCGKILRGGKRRKQPD